MSNTTDYVFDTPDLFKEYVRTDGTKVRLYAYRTKNTDKLLEKKEYKGLRWVSLGKPEIVKLNNNLILFNKLSFSLYFEMLTQRDKEELADEVRRSKGFTVDSLQFSDIDSNAIECTIELVDQKNKKHFLVGKVLDKNQSPYELVFKYLKDSKERLLFEEEIKSSNPIDLKFECKITAGAYMQKSNTFTITLQESNRMRLSEKVFGPSNEVNVTRNQLAELGNEVYSCFNVVQDYQIPEETFSSAFVDNIIALTGQTTFKPVSFQDALLSLSKYSVDISGDLKPTQIKNEMSKLFTVAKTGSKSHIVFDDKYSD